MRVAELYNDNCTFQQDATLQCKTHRLQRVFFNHKSSPPPTSSSSRLTSSGILSAQGIFQIEAVFYARMEDD
ncbi:hypothetical protein GQX74_002818 [Glossina fuscipes]|nr:hypothetical protein GQX74_002818 [Glossina fuscipes]